MKDQILDILNQYGVDWIFSDLKVKLSPHTPPMKIHAIRKDNDKWVLHWDSTHDFLEEINNREALGTIYQRLKIMTRESSVAN